jgi:peptidoglycan/xylan/chitin deacetylase (PgdA/CDA1 family)
MAPDDPQFFMTTDIPVEGPPRELVGYGEHPPKVRWENDAKVAVQIVINYEEGSEKSFAMGDGVNDIMYELPFALEGQRDLAVESMYEYGSRAGIWRMFRVFDAAGVPVTIFGAAVALERNPEVAKKLAARGDETVGHGYRWSNHFEMSRDDEREAIRLAIESIERTTGARPLGWYCREMSVNTRELVVEEGGFVYDSDSYNADPRPRAPRRALRARRERRAVHRRHRVRQPRPLLRDGQGASRPAAQRR